MSIAASENSFAKELRDSLTQLLAAVADEDLSLRDALDRSMRCYVVARSILATHVEICGALHVASEAEGIAVEASRLAAGECGDAIWILFVGKDAALLVARAKVEFLVLVARALLMWAGALLAINAASDIKAAADFGVDFLVAEAALLLRVCFATGER